MNTTANTKVACEYVKLSNELVKEQMFMNLKTQKANIKVKSSNALQGICLLNDYALLHDGTHLPS